MNAKAVRLKFICRLGYGDALPKDAEAAGDIPVFGSNGPYATTHARNTETPAIVLGRKGSYGKVNWAPNGCFASDTTFFIDDRLTKSNIRWLYWGLQTLRLDEGSQEAAVPGLNRESVYEERVLLPEPEAQLLIADYLDRETAYIDSLLAEKERMLVLLEEKRAALISLAVTRGLVSDVPLKFSGIAWLGKIPDHWEVRKLKRSSSRIDTGTTPAASYMDGSLVSEFTWYTPSDFQKDGVLGESNRKIPQEAVDDGEAKVFQPGSILIIGIGATLGKVGICYEEFSANQQINIVTACEGVSPDFLLYALLGYESVFHAHANTATLPILNQERLGVISIALPPIDEQQEIVLALNKKKQAYKQLAENIETSLCLLKERRAALITAAVTGQITPKEVAA